MTRIVEVDKPRRDALGKMLFFNYDWINDQNGQCTYCLTDAQVQLIFTMLDYIGWQTRWESSTGTIDLDIIEQYKTDLAEALMSNCCDQPPLQFRFDPETGAYQVSTDGGATWADAPQYDPRETSTVNLPPSAFGFDTTKCQNADSMVKFIQQEMIDSIAADAAISAILGVVGTAILSLATGGTLLFFSGLLDAVVSGIFAFGIVAWQAAFTTGVIDDFRCAIFNNMDSDDSIDDAGVTALLAYINSHFTGIVVPTLYGYVNGMGRVGCTNAIRSNRGDPDADCSACEDGCASAFMVTFGTEIGRTASTVSVAAAFNAPDGVYHAQISTGDMDVCCTVDYEPPVLNLNHVYYPCGLDSSHAVINGVIPSATPVWLVDQTSGSSFVVTYNLT